MTHKWFTRLCAFLIIGRTTTTLGIPDSSSPPITSSVNSASANVYGNLPEGEYERPMTFPDHWLERKAQRSPSLRLRFGRSNLNDENVHVKYFPYKASFSNTYRFGDVKQKPIRSPSLRLRFGRRSDPLIAKENYLKYMNEIGQPSEEEFNKDLDPQQRKQSMKLHFDREDPFKALSDDNIEDNTSKAEELELIFRVLEEFINYKKNNNLKFGSDICNPATSSCFRRKRSLENNTMKEFLNWWITSKANHD